MPGLFSDTRKYTVGRSRTRSTSGGLIDRNSRVPAANDERPRVYLFVSINFQNMFLNVGLSLLLSKLYLFLSDETNGRRCSSVTQTMAKQPWPTKFLSSSLHR